MFTQVESSPVDVIDIVVTGKITQKDYESLYPVMEEHINKFGKLRLLVELSEFEWPSTQGMWEDIRMSFKYYNDVEKAALITRKEGFAKVSSTIGSLMPNLQFKTFEPGQRDKALEWLRNSQ